MPAQDFRNENGEHLARMVWDFGYKEILASYGDRTFQLHNLEQLRSEGVRIGLSKKDELFVYLARTRDGERFQLSLNGEQLSSDLVEFATSNAAITITPQKVTANVAPPSKGKWRQQERVESARRWCRALAAGGGAATLYIGFVTKQFEDGPRVQALISLGICAVALLLIDMLSKTDTGARLLMFLPVGILGWAAFSLARLYAAMLDSGTKLQSIETGVTALLLLAIFAAMYKCVVAQSSASQLCKDAREHRKIHPVR